jgi:hypothetical protein
MLMLEPILKQWASPEIPSTKIHGPGSRYCSQLPKERKNFA